MTIKDIEIEGKYVYFVDESSGELIQLDFVARKKLMSALKALELRDDYQNILTRLAEGNW